MSIIMYRQLQTFQYFAENVYTLAMNTWWKVKSHFISKQNKTSHVLNLVKSKLKDYINYGIWLRSANHITDLGHMTLN